MVGAAPLIQYGCNEWTASKTRWYKSLPLMFPCPTSPPGPVGPDTPRPGPSGMNLSNHEGYSAGEATCLPTLPYPFPSPNAPFFNTRAPTISSHPAFNQSGIFRSSPPIGNLSFNGLRRAMSEWASGRPTILKGEWEWLVGPILYKGSAHAPLEKSREDNPSFWEWGGSVDKSMPLEIVGPPMETPTISRV